MRKYFLLTLIVKACIIRHITEGKDALGGKKDCYTVSKKEILSPVAEFPT